MNTTRDLRTATERRRDETRQAYQQQLEAGRTVRAVRPVVAEQLAHAALDAGEAALARGDRRRAAALLDLAEGFVRVRDGRRTINWRNR